MPYSHLAQRSPNASIQRSFVIGLIQMVLMCTNIRNMAGGHMVFAAFFTVINTYVWIYVVTTAIHSTRWERFSYAIGSAFGTVLGVLFSRFIIQPHTVTKFAAFFA
jgi:uncharacterized membrane protein required for colicin V production